MLRGRCYSKPTEKAGVSGNRTRPLSWRADESVILAYWQLRDGIADHGLVSGLKYRAGRGFWSTLIERLPRCGRTLMMPFAGSLGFCSELEQENDPSWTGRRTALPCCCPRGGRGDRPVRPANIGTAFISSWPRGLSHVTPLMT